MPLLGFGEAGGVGDGVEWVGCGGSVLEIRLTHA